MPFWATATSARFYAPFLAPYLLALLICFTAPALVDSLMIAAAALPRG